MTPQEEDLIQLAEAHWKMADKGSSRIIKCCSTLEAATLHLRKKGFPKTPSTNDGAEIKFLARFDSTVTTVDMDRHRFRVYYVNPKGEVFTRPTKGATPIRATSRGSAREKVVGPLHRECPFCKKGFVPNHGQTRFCSPRCQRREYRAIQSERRRVQTWRKRAGME